MFVNHSPQSSSLELPMHPQLLASPFSIYSQCFFVFVFFLWQLQATQQEFFLLAVLYLFSFLLFFSYFLYAIQQETIAGCFVAIVYILFLSFFFFGYILCVLFQMDLQYIRSWISCCEICIQFLFILFLTWMLLELCGLSVKMSCYILTKEHYTE